MADTPSTNAYNLVDYHLMSNEPLVKEVTLQMLKATPLYEKLPVTIKKSFTMKGSRITDQLPDNTGTSVYDAPQISKTDPRPFTEEAYNKEFGFQVHDLYRMEENAIQDPMDVQAKGAIQGHVFRCNNAFINNNHVTGDSKWVVGIRERLDNPGTFGTNPDCKRDAGGAAADMSPTGATAVTFTEYSRQVDTLLEETNATQDGNTIIVLGSALYHLWNANLRRFSGSGGFSQSEDQFGRTINKYDGIPVMRAGRLAPTGTYPALTQSQVITATETAAGADGASTFSSLYVIRFGDNGLMGWSFDRLKTFPPEKLSGLLVWQVLMRETLGLFQTDPRAVGRLFDIKVS